MSLSFEMKGSLASHDEAKEKAFRDALVEVEIRRGIPVQIREMREDRGWSQDELGQKLGMPQNNISRIENKRDGYLSIKTLVDIASVFDVGLLVKFVPFSEVLRWTDNHSVATVVPKSYDGEISNEADEAAAEERARTKENVIDIGTFLKNFGAGTTRQSSGTTVSLARRGPLRASEHGERSIMTYQILAGREVTNGIRRITPCGGNELSKPGANESIP